MAPSVVRIKRRTAGSPGAPPSLENAEQMFNEVDETLYYGKGTGGAGGTATAIIPIGGPGAFVARSGDQTIDGLKTFSASPTVPAPTAAGHAINKGAAEALVSAAAYSHPTGDGNLHVPATGTANSGKFLKAGATAGSVAWAQPTKADVGLSSVDDTADANKPLSGPAKSYIDGIVAAQDGLKLKGVINASANPNYPAGDAGDLYRISVAGKIGGAAGPNVEIADMVLCTVDGSAAGTHTSVGANWTVMQANLDGTYFAGGNDVAIADGGTGASTAALARVNLGLSTMATQNAASVAITGGTIDGVTIDCGTV